MSQDKTNETIQEANEWIIDVVTSEAAIKPIIDTWTSETIASRTALGEPTQVHTRTREQLCEQLTNVIRPATMQRIQQSDTKRLKRWAPMELGTNGRMEVEPEDPAL